MSLPCYRRYVTADRGSFWRRVNWLAVSCLLLACDSRALDPGEDARADLDLASDLALSAELTISPDALVTDGHWPPDQLQQADLPPVNEAVFGAQWPTLVFVLENSAAMTETLLGSSKTTAWNMQKQVMSAFSMNSFPVRAGLVLYNDKAYSSVPIPATNYSNTGAMKAALYWSYVSGLNNTAAGLKAASKLLAAHTGTPGYVVLVSAGIPTAAPGCKPNSSCCISSAAAQASLVRNNTKATLVTVEIRKTNYTKALTTALKMFSGKPGTAGNDPSMHHMVASYIGIEAFLNTLTRSTCAFGPLPIKPGASVPKKVSAYLREKKGDKQIPRVSNRDQNPLAPGFEYHVTGKGAHVILTVKTCNDLGYMPQENRIVVRW